MFTLSEVKVPFKTSARRLLRRAGAIVGKRRTYPVHFPSTPPSPISVTSEKPHQSPRTNRFRIALLSEVSVDDVVVVSALASAPFCCHADLLAMSTNQLTAVARMLNDALPPPLHINIEAGRKPGEIRTEIESIVGLRPPHHHHTTVTLARPLPRFHLESPVAHRSPATSNGVPFSEDIDSDISLRYSPPQQRRHISPSLAVSAPTTSQASLPSVVLGCRAPRSVADTDMSTAESFRTRSRLSDGMGQVMPRMSTPVKGVEANYELTFGLEGFTVENPTELSSGSLHVGNVNP